jgi:hypothetical protein
MKKELSPQNGSSSFQLVDYDDVLTFGFQLSGFSERFAS